MNIKKLAVRKIELNYFRNYKYLNLDFDTNPIVLYGSNGSGKTNILEALSLLSPGRGLRSANINDYENNFYTIPWQIKFFIEGMYGPTNVEINKTIVDKEDNIAKKNIILNEQKIRTSDELAKIFSVIWLTPQMDGIFIGAASERRKFFDRLVYNFNNLHATRVYKYEYYIRERNKILKSYNYDKNWLKVVEKKLVENGIAISAARVEALEYLQEAIDHSTGNFPKAQIRLVGEIEQMITNNSALKVEEEYLFKLEENRVIDARYGRTTLGPHRTDLVVIHDLKKQEAKFCSTGEQKALLISLILADIKAKITKTNAIPIVLLDEVIAHLDYERKNQLFDELKSLNCQYFLTGIDKEIFKELKNVANFYNVAKLNMIETCL